MEDSGDLWKGGPWEQPSPCYPVPPRVVVPDSPRRKRPAKRRSSIWKGVLVLLLIVSVLTGAGMGLNFLFNQYFPSQIQQDGEQPNRDWQYYDDEQTSTDPPSIPQADTGTGVTVLLEGAGATALSYQEIYRQASPSIVSIESVDDYGYSTGTGIVLTQDGYIVTNAHVVAGASSVRVIFRDNSWLEASLVGFDASEDLAVLKVAGENLTPAHFGDSDLLQVGESVAALGDPLGYRATMTDGIISALNRDVDIDDYTMNLIQTSAAINFGNSGGALLNRYGQVVGVTTIKIVTEDGSSEALGFAIPSQRLKYVADRLIDGKTVQRAAFGITVDTRQAASGGLQVIGVDETSDAAAQGIHPGDVILQADGVEIHTAEDLTQLKQRCDVGDPVVLTLLRDNEQIQVTVHLVEAP